MDFKKLLLRQLSHAGCDINHPPKDLQTWHNFLDRINRSYSEADQERYLLDRSMAISSREMKELNEKLETAQEMAKLGYWYHDITTGENIWSKELYDMFELRYGDPAPTIEDLLKLVYEEDKNKLKNHITKALSDGERYDIEIRLKGYGKNSKYRWYHIIGHPYKHEKTIHRVSGITMDINNRKIGEERIAVLNQQLVSSARLAGMAEVATSILHNVGNVLNSINVSIGILQEESRNPYFDKLAAIGDLLREHLADINEYITNDERGKLIPHYLIELIHALSKSYINLREEINNLKINIEHVKQITEMQMSLSKVSRVVEKINVNELIQTAIKMVINDFKKKDITLITDIDSKISIVTDKSKILQIIVNLIQNAKDALIANEAETHKKLSISTKTLSTSGIQLIVKDNGIGISKENMKKIFNFGFSTKVSGHGFGLHASALAAKELGGSLEITSDGPSTGVTAILTLPLIFKSRKKNYESEDQLENNYHR